jgi:hypothetical protein
MSAHSIEDRQVARADMRWRAEAPVEFTGSNAGRCGSETPPVAQGNGAEAAMFAEIRRFRPSPAVVEEADRSR